jgi:uncharacterized protein (DUF2164 family)
MTIELPKDTRARAIASIERWFETERDERIGNISAGALLGFFLDEIAPGIYNLGVAHAQARMQERLAELDIEVHEDEFGYWRKLEAAAKKRR